MGDRDGSDSYTAVVSDPYDENPVGSPLGPRLVSAALVSALGLAAVPIQDDPVLALAWLAIWAPAAGALAQSFGRLGLLVPAGFVAWILSTPFDHRFAAVGAILGLTSVGWGLGTWMDVARARIFGVLLLTSAMLAGLPGAGGRDSGAAWPPEVAAVLLSLSPVTLAAESAGVDWMTRPAVYEPVGADAIGPDLRVPYRRLAGWVLLLVGCGICGGARLHRRRASGS